MEATVPLRGEKRSIDTSTPVHANITSQIASACATKARGSCKHHIKNRPFQYRSVCDAD